MKFSKKLHHYNTCRKDAWGVHLGSAESIALPILKRFLITPELGIFAFLLSKP